MFGGVVQDQGLVAALALVTKPRSSHSIQTADSPLFLSCDPPLCLNLLKTRHSVSQLQSPYSLCPSLHPLGAGG